MRLIKYLLLALFISFPLLCRASDAGPVDGGGRSVEGFPVDTAAVVNGVGKREKAVADSLSAEERNQRFYDSLAVRSNRNRLSRTLHRLLVKPKRKTPTDYGRVRDETEIYDDYSGRTIASIAIERQQIFPNARSVVQKMANGVHVTTRESTVRRDLLFRVGDEIDPGLLVRNKQLIRSRHYIGRVDIILEPVEGDSTAVNVKLVTRDTWTISGGGEIAGLTGRTSLEVFDYNFLGLGDRFSYRLSYDWKQWDYEGSLFDYSVPNLLGTFYSARFSAGRSFHDTRYTALIDRRIINPDDYAAGIQYQDINTRYRMVYVDDELLNKNAEIGFRSWDLWGGKAFHVEDKNYSFYIMARAYGIDYYKARVSSEYEGEMIPFPELIIAKGYNPSFHDRNLYLGSLGIYREQFLTTKLIYGYGITEYVPIGYRAEVTGGWMDGQFDSGVYGGASFRFGRFTKAGYFMWDISAGSFYDPGADRFFRSALNLRFHYFTNMLTMGKYNVRNFLTLNYAKGWNREEGADEWIRLTTASGPRYTKIYTPGRERATASLESVLFTPWQPMGFRMALYGFADVGLIGDNRNVFRNALYSTIGVGIRVRNEMLVFSTLQFSLSVSFGPNGLVGNDWVRLSTESRMQSQRYLPEKPDIVAYR